ncbi:glucose-6-phosphate dehydrogenase assembly protein OpcA [Falsarthrobacter nasiphocae]|uniref:Glucose-6-phosphate dehydrogenase assembly protein OpcA n=1 Tax=Falsarthrobacter nasiphocae TaxID=189863 RepID=A0AAE4C4A2_9MICC|nr:glucose-6-phosphate dehydrogenase assembly protein OpcA [Falsarthrobacter nasiphocae]MDR6891156.1 glucose-6-phosphate dehydrogenase assembly protein OpcA [Falsarthrobacter nasiphocae]
MIVDLPSTTVSKVDKALNRLRKEGGVSAVSRVLTLLVQSGPEGYEEAVEAANAASREHPCRVVVLVAGDPEAEARLDAQIRVGGDAGASEVIVLEAHGALAGESESLVSGLLLPDAPIVLWWPDGVAGTKTERTLGRMATRRITDSAADDDPRAALLTLAGRYRPGDTDLAWTRLTLWRGQLAAIVDLINPATITQITVDGAPNSPSTTLLAAWLSERLPVRVTVASTPTAPTEGVTRIRISRPEGDIELVRTAERVVELYQPGQNVQRISLPERTLEDCLSEELRRLDADEVFGEVIKSPMIRTSLRSVRPSER